MFELKVIDKKISENSFTRQNENRFGLLYELSETYGPELVEMMYESLMKERTFRYYFNKDHEIVVTLLPVAD